MTVRELLEAIYTSGANLDGQVLIENKSEDMIRTSLRTSTEITGTCEYEGDFYLEITIEE